LAEGSQLANRAAGVEVTHSQRRSAGLALIRRSALM